MYARNLYDLDNGNYYLNPAGVSQLNQLNVSRDGSTECCSGGAYTISLAEATSTTGKMASLQFHNGGASEGFMRLAASGTRRMEFGDFQGQGMSLNPNGNVYPQTHVNRLLGLSNLAWFDTYTDAIFRNYEFGLSDERMKTNIRPMSNATSRIMQLTAKVYDFDVEKMYGAII